MLEKFHVPEDIEVRVRVQDLRWTAEELLKSTGMPEDDAVQAADVLVYADVRGIETHGVSNMLRVYVGQLEDGGINPTPDWKIVQDNKATCVIDGDGGHGMVISPIGMKEAIRRASEYGVGAVSVMNCRHLGPCSYYAEMAREQDMLGMATTTGGMSMVPTFGTKPLLGLNAMSFAAPTAENPPFVYDASPSVVAGNKITLAKRLGQTVEAGWITDADGVPIMEESEIPEKYMMLPVGSTREGGSQKGYAYSMISEILTSVLCATGGRTAQEGRLGPPLPGLRHIRLHRPGRLQGRHGPVPHRPAGVPDGDRRGQGALLRLPGGGDDGRQDGQRHPPPSRGHRLVQAGCFRAQPGVETHLTGGSPRTAVQRGKGDCASELER